MVHSDSFEKIFPFILGNLAKEVGNLVGDPLTLQSEATKQGGLSEIFSPPEKEIVLVSLSTGDDKRDSAYIVVDLSLAIDLGGKLIMLPQDEIGASKKKKELEGDLLDAFSEIANIMTSVVNTAFRNHFPKKIHFVRGDLKVVNPGSNDFPFLGRDHDILSGSFKSESIDAGECQFVFPRMLLANGDAEEEDGKRGFQEGQEPNSEKAALEREGLERADDRKFIETFLLKSLPFVEEDLAVLLNCSVRLVDGEAKRFHKSELQSKAEEKKVLIRIAISGERVGEGFIMVPLNDAIFLGGTLLLMPPESIAEEEKNENFKGGLADSFAELAHILVSCFSNRFNRDFPLKLSLKKDSVETFVSGQADMPSLETFRAENYYSLSARIRIENADRGLLEVFIPLEVLGISEADEYHATEEKGEQNSGSLNGEGQKSNSSQKSDSGSVSRIISLVGQDQAQLEIFKESLSLEDYELLTLSPENDLRKHLGNENLCCVFLFIGKTNDLGFAQTIKVRAAMKNECPLIVAGSDWTRTKVLKALKYGANDILITPAKKESVRKKCQKHSICRQEKANEYASEANG